jgi:hypothetical protein
MKQPDGSVLGFSKRIVGVCKSKQIRDFNNWEGIQI